MFYFAKAGQYHLTFQKWKLTEAYNVPIQKPRENSGNSWIRNKAPVVKDIF